MEVTRLPRDPGPAAWNRLLPEAAPATPLEGATTADWLIIGAGFAGLAAARRLSQNCPGDRITILDATQVGEGPAGRNSGFMIDLPHDLASDGYSGALDRDRAQTADNRLAIAFAEEMFEDFGLPEETFRKTGKVNAAATAKGARINSEYARHLAALDEPHEQMSAKDMQEMTGIDYYRSGLFTPGAVTIQPAMFIRGIAEGLRSNRMSLHENSPVIRLERRGDWVATTLKGQVTAPRVILAVNGHLNSFGFAQGRLMHVFTYASMTRALTPVEAARLGGHAHWGVLPADPQGTTVRRINGVGGVRIVVRNRFTFDPSMEVEDRRIARVARDHDASFRARFPELAGVEMEYRWGGRLCLSLNGVQLVAEVEEGLFTACCQNGLGTTRGTLAGMLAADLATGRRSDALNRITDAVPKRLPPEVVSRVGANLRLRWGAWRAGGEF
ncbi:MAG: FAD-binding oxidoreductase [Pseudomonadota bacterium]